MAVDRPGDYVGNHGGGYIDNDGQRKQFTYIDHDPKTKISGSVPTDEEKEEFKKAVADYRELIIQEILEMPPSLCPLPFHEFVLRGENQVVLEWNKTMVTDKGMTFNRLRDLHTLLSNRMDIDNKRF